MKREYCQRCLYPKNSCLCKVIKPMSVVTEVVVLQHPSEVKHAKNTVRLLALALPQIRIVVGESPADFVDLRRYLEEQTKPVYVVYPNEHSQTVAEAGASEAAIIILVDGTWRKAYRMLQLNPWLGDYPSLHLEVEDESQYIIRKAKRSDSLSTLEAAAHTLVALNPNVDVTPIFAVFNAMVQHKLTAMPALVRGRYNVDNIKG
ncbi:tRNA-uridine aminocarboxypropyltransferase [Shewanella polaris]|uniref:tRNA-uridine aminocarboxypropyltransferase n=1 Tax=Shewanella polaris TaxID=2588449 RepID=A0A4Y5YAD5_9GAMM|nr:tRNA-uridine aminocarboxypropyltransferase [Shewanella polaris]QDE29731.1 DTW domain-containing protein [Shewanella polaris]